jgi:formylglycine-generating enzyme required for sulfatase activity
MKIISTAILSILFLSFSTQKKSKSKKTLKKEFAFISSGSLIYEQKEITVQGFYMKSTEVTNKEYRLFLADLKQNNKLADYALYLPDTNAWTEISKNTFLVPMKEYYFWHPAYDNYPVACVSHVGAIAYCKWFTEKINTTSKTGEKLIFRLPTKEEYLKSCAKEKTLYKYAWGTDEIRNSKGNILCNHVHIDTIASKKHSLLDGQDIVAPSKSYWTNQNGIYNLNGNLAEMINEFGIAYGGSWRNEASEVTSLSTLEYKKASALVGFRMVANSR